MNDRTYTFTECYSLLDVSPKTFRKWLVLASINSIEQVSNADSRVKRLTLEQLTNLAEQHERSLILPPDEQEQAEPLALHTDVPHFIQDALDIIEQRLQQLEQDRDTLSRQIAAVQHTIEQMVQRGPQLQPVPSKAKVKNVAQRETIAPTDLVSLRTFAEQHAVNGNEAFHQWKNGATLIIPAQKVTRRGKTSDVFIDKEGKHSFWVSFHKEPGFRNCDDCPHQ